MFRFLIAEDKEDLLDELDRKFMKWFPKSKIETAVAVDQGLALIRDAESSGWFYDAAVLDFKLPRQRGLQDEVDETLCHEIKKNNRSTFVVHVTGYGDDREVLEHLKKSHQGGDPLWALVEKSTEMWSDLEKKVKAHLYGSLIARQMDKLFDASPGATPRAALAAYHRPSEHGGSITLELAELMNHISSHWRELDEKLKCRIRERFYVYDKGGDICVSLLE